MTDWLLDKSALARIGTSPDAEAWATRAERGLLRISTPTLLEQGYSARSGADWQGIIHGTPVAWFPIEYLTPRAEQRALEVQSILAGRGQHRAPSIPDLLIAAIAEVGSLVVLHLDKDFDLIAEVTGQPLERLRA
jgi:predicted nucleic acid-binding protein